MPASTYCPNCCQPKDPIDYMNYYCGSCETLRKEASEYARKEGLDPAAVSRQALASRAGHAMREKDPRAAFTRMDTSAIEKRLSTERGSANDPTRSGYLRF